MDIKKKREKEKKMLDFMVGIYCRGKHKSGKVLCPQCEELLQYAHIRTDKCPFMATKTFCSACKVHCYSREMQGRIKEVMRYAGSRMLLHHPCAAVSHMCVTLKGRLKKQSEK